LNHLQQLFQINIIKGFHFLKELRVGVDVEVEVEVGVEVGV
jgi:hypothetical protein